MMHSDNCFYCKNGAMLDYYEIKICNLKCSTVYLFRDQKHKGRCVVAFKDHRDELYELSPNELTQFMSEVAMVASAISELFCPDKINYAVYGDLMSHVHFHIVPKYKDGLQWGKPFTDDIDRVLLSDTQYKELIDNIRQKLIG